MIKKEEFTYFPRHILQFLVSSGWSSKMVTVAKCLKLYLTNSLVKSYFNSLKDPPSVWFNSKQEENPMIHNWIMISTSPRFHPHANSIAKHIQTKCVYWYFTLLTDVLIYIFKISILYLIVLINRLLKGTFLLVFSFYLNSLKNLLGKGFWKNQIFAKRNPPLFQGEGA